MARSTAGSFGPGSATGGRAAVLAAALGLLGPQPSQALEGPPAPRSASEETSVCRSRCAGLAAVQFDEPGITQAEALAVGLAAGLGLGLSLRDGRSGGPASTPTDWRPADAAVLGSAAALYLGSELAWRHEPPDLLAGRWSDCERAPGQPGRDTLNGFDRGVRSLLVGGAPDEARQARWLRRREQLDRLSYATVGAALALPLGAAGGSRERDLLVTLEAMSLAGAASAAVKHVVHRPRPFVHFCDAADREALCRHDAQLSFFSGHTALAFAGAVAAGRLADLRGSRQRRAVWASGLALATTTGLLRISADKHYATDVLAGLVVGGAAGWFVPKLHRPRAPLGVPEPPAPQQPVALVQVPLGRPSLGRPRLSVGLLDGGPMLAVSGSW